MSLQTITPSLILFGKRLAALYQTINASVPIVGFVSADAVTKAVVIEYPTGTTQPQKDQAAAIVVGFVWTQAAQDAFEDTQSPDFAALRAQAVAAVQTNNAYLAIASPTNADRFTELDALVRQSTQLIKTQGAVIIRLTGR